MLGFMPGFGIGIGLAVRLGATLPLSVERAGKLTAGTFVACVVLFASMSLIMYGCRGWIFSLFTTEEAVIDGAHEIWRKVCIYYFNLCIYALNMGIATGLGQQWMFGTVTVTTLWGVSLPSMYYLCIIRGGGLSTAWACITQPYIAMNAFLVFQFFFRLDWKDIQHAIRIREGMDHRMSIDAPLVDNGESHNGHPLGLDRSVQMRESSSTIDERTGLLLVQNGVHAHNY
jgi:Na+-driven multidrug efflux pump